MRAISQKSSIQEQGNGGVVAEGSAPVEEQVDEAVAAKPKRVVPPRNGCNFRMTQQRADEIYKDWQAGERRIDRLARAHGLSWQTIDHLAHYGYPKRGIQSLELRYAREALVSVKQGDVAPATAEKMLNLAIGEWEKAKADDAVLLGGTKAILSHVIKALKTVIPNMSFTKTHRYKDKSGTWVSEKVPLDATELVYAIREVCRALREIIAAECTLFGKPLDREGKGEKTDWTETLSDEQLDEMIKTGNIPPEVPDELIFGGRQLKSADGSKN